MINIICYTGGTCGDLVAAIIDPTGCKFYQNAVMHAPDRIKLKKSHLFNNNEEKDQYIDTVGKQYLSIPSHDIDYHIDRKHNFIGITVHDKKTAIWAANRFKKLHRPSVWEEMCNACGAKTVDDYAQILIDYSYMVSNHTNRLIKLEDIINGNAIDSLIQLGIEKPSVNLYNNWLAIHNGHFII